MAGRSANMAEPQQPECVPPDALPEGGGDGDGESNDLPSGSTMPVHGVASSTTAAVVASERGRTFKVSQAVVPGGEPNRCVDFSIVPVLSSGYRPHVAQCCSCSRSSTRAGRPRNCAITTSEADAALALTPYSFLDCLRICSPQASPTTTMAGGSARRSRSAAPSPSSPSTPHILLSHSQTFPALIVAHAAPKPLPAQP